MSFSHTSCAQIACCGTRCACSSWRTAMRPGAMHTSRPVSCTAPNSLNALVVAHARDVPTSTSGRRIGPKSGLGKTSRASRVRTFAAGDRRERCVFLNTRHRRDPSRSARGGLSLSLSREKARAVSGDRVDHRSGTGALPSRSVEGKGAVRACRSSPPRSSLFLLSRC